MSADHAARVLHVHYTDKQSLYSSYLSFCRDGGVFVPAAGLPDMAVHLGQPVHLLVELPDDRTLHTVSGRVAWINLNKRRGFGVRLLGDEYGRSLRAAIENTLAGALKSPNATHTM